MIVPSSSLGFSLANSSPEGLGTRLASTTSGFSRVVEELLRRTQHILSSDHENQVPIHGGCSFHVLYRRPPLTTTSTGAGSEA
jgi:hypothetical protein